MSGVLKIRQVDATAVFSEHFCRKKSVIHQLCLNGGACNREMVGGFLNHVRRGISGHELLKSLDRAQKFGCKRPAFVDETCWRRSRATNCRSPRQSSDHTENAGVQIGARAYAQEVEAQGKEHLDWQVSASRGCEFPKVRVNSRHRGYPRTSLFLSNLGGRFLSLSGPKQLEPLLRGSLRIRHNLKTFDFVHFSTSSITMLMKLTTVSNACAAEPSGFVK
jgi:hypothetical protein